MSVGAINIASRGLVLNNSVGNVNLFPWVHHDTLSRGQLSRSPLGGHNNSLEDKLKSTLLSIAGYYCIAFAIFHTLFWKLFRWKTDLQRLSDINRAVMQVLNLCLTFVFLFMGIAVLLYQPDFLGTKLGTYLLVSMAIFWILRAAEQIIFFDIKNIISSFLFGMFIIGSGLFLIPVL